MLFKDIKQNYPIFILDKQNLTLTQGKVISAGFPRVEMMPSTGKSEMVIDFSIEADGKTGTYVIPESLSVSYAGNLIISPDKTSLVNEIEAMKATAEQVLASVKHHEDVLAKSSGLLAELNPAYKERQEYERRLDSMEKSIADMKGLMEGFINEFKK